MDMVSKSLFLPYLDGEGSVLGQCVRSARVYPAGSVCQARHEGGGVCCLPDPLPADPPGECPHRLPRLQPRRAPQTHVLLPGQPELPRDVLRVRDHAQPARGAVDGTLPRALHSLPDSAFFIHLPHWHQVYPPGLHGL